VSDSPDDRRTLERMLTTATASKLPDEAMPDEETAELREGWLSLTELLHAADDKFRPDEVLVPLQRRNRARMIRRLAAAALAASLLIALTVGLHYFAATVPNGSPAPPRQVATHDTEQPVVEPDLTNDIPDWDDTFDEQLALAGQQVSQVRESWRSPDVSYDVLVDQLYEMEEEITDESL